MQKVCLGWEVRTEQVYKQSAKKNLQKKSHGGVDKFGESCDSGITRAVHIPALSGVKMSKSPARIKTSYLPDQKILEVERSEHPVVFDKDSFEGSYMDSYLQTIRVSKDGVTVTLKDTDFWGLPNAVTLAKPHNYRFYSTGNKVAFWSISIGPVTFLSTTSYHPNKEG